MLKILNVQRGVPNGFLIGLWYLPFLFSLSLAVCICVCYVGLHEAWVAPEQKDFCRDSDSEAAMLMLRHILAFLRDFSPLSPRCTHSALLVKACLKCLIILCKLTDQGNILRGSSWAHHFVWGDFKLLSSSLSAHSLASLSFFFFFCNSFSLWSLIACPLPLSLISLTCRSMDVSSPS